MKFLISLTWSQQPAQVLIPSQMNPVQALLSCFFEIYFTIFQIVPSFAFSYENFVCTSLFPMQATYITCLILLYVI